MNNFQILVVDDDDNIRELIRDTLTIGDYNVLTAVDGKDAWNKLKDMRPDLVITDVEMPKMNGYELCAKIKADSLLSQMPVLILTVKGREKDEIKGLSSGANDYLVKPFKPSLLFARVTNIIHHNSMMLDVNPLTRIPGNVSIQREVEKRLKENKSLAVFYVDLDNFKEYNDRHGFKKGDVVIRKTANILMDSAKKIKTDETFVGHIGGDDFIIVSSLEKIQKLCEEIITKFDREIEDFYSIKDREKGYIVTKNRKGEIQKFGIMTISIAVVTNQKREITHFGQIAAISAELKKIVKKKDKSSYLIDRRSD